MSADHYTVYEKIGLFRTGTIITIGAKNSPYDVVAYYLACKAVGFRFTIEDTLAFAEQRGLSLTMPAARRVLYLMKDQVSSTRTKKRSKDPIPQLDYTNTPKEKAVVCREKTFYEVMAEFLMPLLGVSAAGLLTGSLLWLIVGK